MKKLLVYNDAMNLGGHEIQMVNAIMYLKDFFEIHFMVSKKNIYLIGLLRDLNITIIEINYTSNRLQILRNFTSIKHFLFLCVTIRKLSPALIINVQGNIGLGSIMLLAAKATSIKCATYIPNCHYLSETTQNGILAKVKDWINFYYYQLPNYFITLNEFNKILIKKRNKRTPVFTVENGINFNKYTIIEKSLAKKELGLIENKKYLALIGRIQFWHKGHDILLSMINKYKDRLSTYKFLVVGQGEDYELLKNTIKEMHLEPFIFLLGHQVDLSIVYSAVDGIVIPSRFESGSGTPMVLIEALYYKLPIVMTKLPEMNRYINEQNLFEKEDIDDFFSKCFKVFGSIDMARPKLNVLERHSLEKFQNEYHNAISTILDE